MDIREKLKLLLGLKKLPEGEDFEGFTDEQLTEAAEKSKHVFAAAKEEKDLETAEEAFAISQAVNEELSKRELAAKEIEERFATLEQQLDPQATDNPDPAGDGSGDGDGNTGDEPAPDGDNSDPAPAGDNPDVPTPVTADADADKDEDNDALKAKLLAAAAKPIVPKASKPPAETSNLPRIIASADISDFSPGMPMTLGDMGSAFVEKAKAVAGSRSKVKSKVAKLYLDNIPADQDFTGRQPPEEVTGRLNELVAEVREETSNRLRQIVAAGRDEDQVIELTAAGGFCRPFPVNYNLCTQGDDVRPLRDSLISTRLDRGGLQYFMPPVLADVDGAVNIYTEEQDTTGYDYPKGCIRVECPDTSDAVVQAITLCMEVGNFQRLAWPEIFQAWWQFGKVLHARTAEVAIWDAMVAGSTARTANSGFGAFRNTITELERYAQQYRYEYRLAASAPLRLWLPYWAVAQLRADLTNQQPGDGTVALSDAQLYQYLAALNIAVTPILDGQDPGSGDDPLPTSVTAVLAQEGTWVFGEMGELDFGTEIRDWDQIRNNDSGAFMETFETVYRVCWGSQAIDLPICPSGTSSAAVADVVVCAS